MTSPLIDQETHEGCVPREEFERVQQQVMRVRKLYARMQQDLPYGGAVHPRDANVRVSDIKAALDPSSED